MTEESESNHSEQREIKNSEAQKKNEFIDIFNKLKNFSIQEKVKISREKINKELAKIPEYALPHKDEKIEEYFRRPLLTASNKISEYPFLSALCRNHGNLVITASTIIVAMPSLWLPRKVFWFNTLSTIIASKSIVEVSKYKWNHSQKNKEKI